MHLEVVPETISKLTTGTVYIALSDGRSIKLLKSYTSLLLDNVSKLAQFSEIFIVVTYKLNMLTITHFFIFISYPS